MLLHRVAVNKVRSILGFDLSLHLECKPQKEKWRDLGDGEKENQGGRGDREKRERETHRQRQTGDGEKDRARRTQQERGSQSKRSPVREIYRE